MTRPLLRSMVTAVALVCGAHANLHAQSLSEDFDSAQRYDPVFAASRAEADNRRIEVRIAGAAYYPQARFSVAQQTTENANRQTLNVTQPVVNVDKWLQLKEVDPRSRLAELAFLQSRYDLASRLFGAVRLFVEARDKLRLNNAKIESLQLQAASAQREFELGFGTRTDVLDTQVRLGQAQAESFNLSAAVETARRSYFSMVGRFPGAEQYQLVAEHVNPPSLGTLESLLSQALASNPNLQSSTIALEIGDIGRRRAKASFLPTLNASYQRSSINGTTSSSSGMRLSYELPIEFGTVFRLDRANIEYMRLQEELRNTQQQVQLQVQQLYNDLQAAQQEVDIRRRGIEAAELSLQANQRSYEGGVRTQLDVLDAVQTLNDSESSYLTARLRLAENHFKLSLLVAVEPHAALQQVHTLLFQDLAPTTAPVTTATNASR